MSNQPSYAAYAIIWVWLIVLLAAGTFISYLPLNSTQAALMILGISTIKAVLVAWFFMHLRGERSLPLWIVITFPMGLIAGAVLLVLSGTLLFS